MSDVVGRRQQGRQRCLQTTTVRAGTLADLMHARRLVMTLMNYSRGDCSRCGLGRARNRLLQQKGILQQSGRQLHFHFFSIARVHSDLIVPWTLLMHVMTAMRPIADDQDLHESLF